MTAPTLVRRTAVRTTTVAVLTAGLLIVSIAGAQAADAPALGSLVPQVNNILSGLLSGNAVSSLLPNGILGG
ncbi:hypothetical protein G9272_22180 [Streptomyces asoensis]|uniref:Secreted protein n=1 Tax=Streptomyces asoensis TaxID=249586 RepID=A0A6M4X372_9ACTN|nr:hypothetical protein [Streptomyces asoensis]QJT02673.1 hypothetical protein G9272_22180 [Streptomyces asoensis]